MAGPRRVPLRFQADCELCGDELDIRKAGVCQWWEGWVEKRDGGGAHGVRAPRKHMMFACGPCVDKLAKGQPAFQPTLFAR